MQIKIKLLIVIVWLVGIPASFVLLHQKNADFNPETAKNRASLPSYNETEVERCFWWIVKEQKEIYEKK